VLFRIRYRQGHPQPWLNFNCLLFFDKVNRLQIPSVSNAIGNGRWDLVMLV
jgi:hypothetical protein